MSEREPTPEEIRKAARALIEKMFPDKFIICEVCGAKNCRNNVLCIKCDNLL